MQAIGTFLALLLVLGSAEASPDLTSLLWAVCGGLGGLLGVTALYLALSRGTMGLIAPLSAVIAAAVPVVISVTTGTAVQPVALVGMLLALGAVVAVAMPGARDVAAPSDPAAGRARLTGWVLAALAGIGFAGYFLGVDRAHAEGVGTWWTLFGARAAGFVVVALAFLVLAARHRLPAAAGVAAAAPILVVSAVGDLGGNLFYVLALGETTLAVAVVLSSLYPVVTALLARLVLGERLTRTALVGVALAIAGVVLIGAGSTMG